MPTFNSRIQLECQFEGGEDPGDFEYDGMFFSRQKTPADEWEDLDEALFDANADGSFGLPLRAASCESTRSLRESEEFGFLLATINGTSFFEQ